MSPGINASSFAGWQMTGHPVAIPDLGRPVTMTPQTALHLLMAALKHNGSTATFFVTGRYFEQNPGFVENIAAQGFEVGYHGHEHIKLSTTAVFEKELENSSRFLDAIRPAGFRAPWVYLPRECMERLHGYGFQYDSSTFGPVGSRFRHNGLDIFPVSSLNYFGPTDEAVYPKIIGPGILKREFPVGSGIFVSWLRHIYPMLLSRFSREKRAVVLYLHDWQLAERKGLEFNLFRDGLRYIHKYPMLGSLLRWVETQPFRHLGHRLEEGDSDVNYHHLTIDVEQLDIS